MNNVAMFTYKPFSRKQKQVLTWWLPTSPVSEKDGIIADGAIRSGKTLAFSLSFGLWAMSNFREENFLLCAQTIKALRRNLLNTWIRQMRGEGFTIRERWSDNLIIVGNDDYLNYFYLFGGDNARSRELVQGITAAGVLFDEVALMEEDFVSQSEGRCSVDGSKFWYNCNPENPDHWFKKKWLDKRENKNLLWLHFTMDDNPSMTEKIKNRYNVMHTGVFRRRFVLGEWCAADGLIYDSFDEEKHTYTELPKTVSDARRYIAIDYGTTNPMCFLEIIDDGDTARVNSEYYYSSKEKGKQKTDAQYAKDFVEFAGNPDDVLYVILDPSAASFKVELRNRGYRVKDADNDVRNGISKVSTMFALGKLLINKKCSYLINELLGYIWDAKAANNGLEKPVKQNDHACDALRYGVATVIYSKRRVMN